MTMEEQAVFDAAVLYARWAHETGDYPHGEQGCEAHAAIVDAVAAAGVSFPVESGQCALEGCSLGWHPPGTHHAGGGQGGFGGFIHVERVDCGSIRARGGAGGTGGEGSTPGTTGSK